MKFNSETGAAAGSKGKRGPSRMTQLLNMVRESQTESDVQTVFDKLYEMAKDGDMDAIKTYLSYIIGKPTEKIEVEGGSLGVILNIKKQDGNAPVGH